MCVRPEIFSGGTSTRDGVLARPLFCTYAKLIRKETFSFADLAIFSSPGAEDAYLSRRFCWSNVSGDNDRAGIPAGE
jgi:hypothetical protein